MGFSKKEIREEKERILKKGGSFLVKDIWEYNGELILFGKLEGGGYHGKDVLLSPACEREGCKGVSGISAVQRT